MNCNNQNDQLNKTRNNFNNKVSKLNMCILKAPKLSLPMLNGYNFCINTKQDVLDGKIHWI